MPIAIVFDPTYVIFLVAVLFLTGLIGVAVFGVYHTWTQTLQRRTDTAYGPLQRRTCRYCKFGDALLHKESVSFEDRDRVTVRCYVCNSCSLPQWFVRRDALTHYAEP